MSTFVIGDIHGANKALVQCLERCGFNNEEDELISLGDICDGWSEVYECVETLLGIKNLIAIRGNHDQWFYEFIRTGIHGSQWNQGADATRNSYRKRSMIIPESHERFFGTQMNYYIDEQNRCFVHGGYNRHELINEQHYPHIYYWDRDLWHAALSYQSMSKSLKYTGALEGDDSYKKKNVYNFKDKNNFKEVFIGHTTTGLWGIYKPMNAANIWNLDTGGGFEGKVTIMNVDTHEFWQSDFCKELYPNERGRN